MLSRMLGQTAEIFLPIKSPDGFGDKRDVWPSVPTQTLPCRLQLISGTERTDSRDVAIGRWKLFLPPAATVTEKARIRVDGRLFEVVSVYPVHQPSGLHHYECELITFSGKVPTS